MGILRVQITEFNILNDKLSRLNGKGQVVLIGVINDEPDVRDTSQKLNVKIGNSEVLVTTDKYPEYNYLDKVKLTGKLEAPAVYDDFNYKNYLLKDGIYSVMNYPKISALGGEKNPNIFQKIYSGILWFKGKMNESIQQNFAPPHSLLLQGIILGNNKNMTSDLRDKLNAAGLRFLTAISGVHVVILSAMLMAFLLALGLYRSQAFYFSIIFIWLYIILTGFSASGIRAATMGSIFLLAEKLGRQNTSSRTIVLAGAAMLLQNPLLLLYDVGFQLSFLASLGIIYLKPAIENFLKIILKNNFAELSGIISVTITAQVFTLPIMVFNFGNISLLATITNTLILPIVPWILGFGFVFSIAGAFSSFLGFIFSIPLWLLTAYFLGVMNFFSRPWMAKTVSNVSWIWLVIFYLVISFFTWLLNKKFSQKFV